MRSTSKGQTAAYAVVILLVAGTVIIAPPALAATCFGADATITAKPGKKTVGTARDDVIVGTNGPDVIEAKGGIDLICSKGGSDEVIAGGGSDAVDGAGGNDVIKGGGGSDVLLGAEGNDKLKAGAGDFDDVLGEAGDDLLDGGGGDFNSATFLFSPAPVSADLKLGTATGEGNDRLVNIDDLFGSQFNDDLTGDTSQDGNGLNGGSGDDVLDGGGGPADIVLHFTATDPVQVDLTAGTSTGEGDDALFDIEDALGSEFADTLTGDADTNLLDGLQDDDVISGVGGDDLLVGSEGNDTIDGGDGIDLVAYLYVDGSVNVNLTTGNASVAGSASEDDILTGIEDVLGSLGDDVIRGDTAANVLVGVAGSDDIFGEAGDDGLDGDGLGMVLFGTDDLDGGDDTDTCVNGETTTNCESARRQTMPSASESCSWRSSTSSASRKSDLSSCTPLKRTACIPMSRAPATSVRLRSPTCTASGGLTPSPASALAKIS
jgi:Ca2+-binding RTX toxin-like protein